MSIAATLLLALFVFFAGGVFGEGGAGHDALDARSAVVDEEAMLMVVLPQSASAPGCANELCEQGYVSNRWVEEPSTASPTFHHPARNDELSGCLK